MAFPNCFKKQKPGGESVFHSFLGSKSLGIENKVQGILKRDTHTYRPFGPVKFVVVITVNYVCNHNCCATRSTLPAIEFRRISFKLFVILVPLFQSNKNGKFHFSFILFLLFV